MTDAGWPQRSYLVTVIIGMASAFLMGLALVYASRAGVLPDAPDQFTYDWRTVLFSDAAEESRDDIAVVLVDEGSLDGYPYNSPVDRGLLAGLIRAIDAEHPKAMGLDFIFDAPTEPAKDAALAEALKSASAPIILGAIDDRAAGVRSKSLKFQDEFLARTGRQAGHVFFADQSNRITLPDQAVRFMAPPSPANKYGEAFARLLADIDGKKAEPSTHYIAWLAEPRRVASPIFAAFRVPGDRNDDGSPKAEPAKRAWLPLLRDKIVLIGGGFPDRDRHLTPFSVAHNERIPGVFIHAQILAQLRDGRSIYAFSFWHEVFLAAGIFALGFLAAQRWALRRDEWLASGAAFLLLIVASFGLFYAYRLILPSSTLVLAWPLGLVLGNAYGRLIQRLTRRKFDESLYRQAGRS
jgi:adenylate cyclase